MTEIVVIVAAMAVGAFVKSVTGAGLPQIAIPTIAIFLGVEHAVVVMAIPGVVTNTWMLWLYRHHLRAARHVPAMVVAGVVGAVVGTMGLKVLDPRWLSLALAGVIVLYLGVRLAKPGFAMSARVVPYTSLPVGLAAGLLQGSTGISGPLLTVYLHSLRLTRQVFVVSLVTMFLVLATVQSVMLVCLGLYDAPRLAQSFLALVPIMIVMGLGARLAHRLSSRGFDRWITVLLVAFATKLIVDAL